MQLAEGTDPVVALCSFGFIVVSVAAFNLAGGFSYPSGAYVFFYSTLGVIVGLCTKAAIGEPADLNLVAPRRTMLVFFFGICAMYGAVFLSRRLRPRKGMLEDIVTDKNLQNATVGSLVAGILAHIAMATLPHSNGSIVSALSQINNFLPMTIILGTIYQVRRSGGRSSVNLPVVFASIAVFLYGLIGFSKQGMFLPFLCWGVAAASQRYRVTWRQIAVFSAALAFVFVYLVPYAQFGRSYEDEYNPSATRWQTIAFLLSNLDYVHQESKASAESQILEGGGFQYFSRDVGLFGRLQMIAPDDRIIRSTENLGPFGMAPIYQGFGNLVPHFLWPDKPIPIGGNWYAHEIGNVIGEEDYTTGISFTPTGEAYRIAKWPGVLILAPILWTMLFTLFDTLCGDTRRSPWGFLAVVYFSHMAPEGMLGGVIYTMGYISVAVIVAALSAAFLMPILGSLLKGPERSTLRKTALVHRGPGPSRTLPASDVIS